jgi:hypothetical protein
MRRRALLMVSIGLLGFTCAAAAEAPHAQLEWRLGFGAGQPVQPGYGLSVGYRGHDADFPATRLFALDVADARAFARLAGLPLFERSYRMGQDEAAAPATSAPAQKPWYGRQWVWWTLGGVAAAASLGGSSISIDETGGGTTGSRSGCAGPSGNVGDEEIPCATEGQEACAGDLCAVCEDGVVTDRCDDWTGRVVRAAPTRDPAHEAWLDAGTGHMGDLLAADPTR